MRKKEWREVCGLSWNIPKQGKFQQAGNKAHWEIIRQNVQCWEDIGWHYIAQSMYVPQREQAAVPVHGVPSRTRQRYINAPPIQKIICQFLK